MFDFNQWLNRFPGTNFHELNIDWLVSAVKQLAEEIQDFEIVNQFTYEGSWDITKQYKKFAIVTVNGTEGYISLQPVPAGIQINNPDYWVMIADYTAVIAGIGARVTALETSVSDLQDETYNWLRGKKLVAYGDSTIRNTGNLTYMDQLGDMTGAIITNRGKAGSKMAAGPNNGTDLINASTDLNTYDVITLSYGTNEWQSSDSLYDIYESCKSIINAIKTKNPYIQIVFICPPYSYHDYGNDPVNLNNEGLFLDDVINCITYYMNSMSIPVIDLYHLSPCNALNYSALLRNDSGGIYVHPTDTFAKTLAAIVKNFDGGAIASYTLDDVLCPYDFYDVQAAYTNADFTANNGFTEKGLYMRFTGTMSDKSVNKVVFSSNLYKIVGTTTDDITLKIGTYSRTIPAGKFNFDVNNIPTGFVPIEIYSTNTTVITDFHVYKVNLKDSTITANAPSFGSRIQLTNQSSSITFLTGSATPTIRFTDKGIDFDFSGFEVTASIPASTDLMGIPGNFTSNVYMHHIIPLYNTTTGATESAEIYGNKIRSTHAMTAGTYVLMGSVNINRCPLVIN